MGLNPIDPSLTSSYLDRLAGWQVNHDWIIAVDELIILHYFHLVLRHRPASHREIAACFNVRT